MDFAAGEAVLFSCWLWLDIGGDIRHVTVEGLAFHRAGIVSSGTSGRALGQWTFRNLVFHEKPQYWAASILWGITILGFFLESMFDSPRETQTELSP